MRPTVIRQPGPAEAPRIAAVEARGRSFEFDLAAGETLLAGIARGFAAAGFVSGTVHLGQVEFSPFAYVMPALSTTGEHAAFYSETYRPAGVSRLDCGSLTFGTRDGLPFLHCHAQWWEADGKFTGGHILPDETRVATRVRVQAFGLSGAVFDARPDPETNFKLFTPFACPEVAAQTDRRVLALRLKPNQDLIEAIETAAKQHDFRRAIIRGGVGSTIGASFEGKPIIENFATEVYLTNGVIRPDATGQPRCVGVSAALVDYTGAVQRGSVVKGANPVLMTFELLLVAPETD